VTVTDTGHKTVCDATLGVLRQKRQIVEFAPRHDLQPAL
jgi:hypothetical protein